MTLGVSKAHFPSLQQANLSNFIRFHPRFNQWFPLPTVSLDAALKLKPFRLQVRQRPLELGQFLR